MPVNKNALIRFRTIDRCLCNRQRRWTLEDLIEKCSEALYELEGIQTEVSKRTIQLDIQNMRSDKLGYAAPIVVLEKKYYTYEDPKFSIDRMPINDKDLKQMQEALSVLRQLKGFSQFQELDLVLKKLEETVKATQKQRFPVILMDTNQLLQGLDWMNELYECILNEITITIEYHPFYRSDSFKDLFFPYLLKEYNKRWYVVGFSQTRHKIALFALDRIVNIEKTNGVPFVKNNFFNPEIYFRDNIGVTVQLEQDPEEIVFWATDEFKNYLETKPIHASQKTMFKYENGIVFSLKLRVNFELIELLLGHSDRIVILKPRSLRQTVLERTRNCLVRNEDHVFLSGLWRQINATSM
jgi:predicted DNA-binding transcriptional regulator YafY